MKQLINLFLGLTLTGMSAFSQQDSLSVKSQDYREKGNSFLSEFLITPQGYSFYIHHYDSNGDWRSDVVEAYLINPGSSEIPKEPLYYFFFNKDSKIDKILLDSEMDGLGNGNEELLYIKPKKVKVSEWEI